MVSAIEKLSESNEELQNLIHLRCSCHVFNLVTKEGLKDPDLEKILAKFKYFCKKIHCSSKRQQELSIKCKLNNEPDIKVVMPIETRWNSELEMCKTALRMQKSITMMSTEICAEFSDNSTEALLISDWVNVDLAIKLFEPFEQSNLRKF